MKGYHALSPAETVQNLQTDAENGLSLREADVRRRRFGKNELSRKKPVSPIRKFLAQFSDVMVLILLACAGVSLAVSHIGGENSYADAVIILLIVFVNAVIGFVQESRAEHAIDALQKLTSPHAMVVRGGKRRRIESADVVPGDLVLLSAGDVVPADLRLLQTLELRAEESSLTGESVPVEKDAAAVCAPGAPLADRKNMAFASTGVVSGHAAGVAVATGMDTAVGQVAEMLAGEESPKTPLQQKLARTGKILAGVVLASCLLIFLLGLLRRGDPLETLLISVSLAVAAIPEGMTAVVTVVLALEVSRMARRRAIVRRLPAVETLGCTTVICTDKTGTLTQNRMEVTRLADAAGERTAADEVGKELLMLASLCTNCSVDASGRSVGDPTETALVRAAGEEFSLYARRYPRLGEIPFTSARKRMTVAVREDTGCRLICKGAPESVLPRCDRFLQNGEIRPLNASTRRRILARHTAMAQDALRVLAVAVRKVPQLPQDDDAAESELIFCGLIGMEDPPRRDVRQAVEQCLQAGVRPVMITGDSAATAVAIARQVGITQNGEVITGTEMEHLTAQQLADRTETCRVFARVSPEHKVKLVKALRARGEVVAMTGDGVNDAPALKAADIGCAMGKSGTEVARMAADMVLTDDCFATVVAAVREGRGVYRNIRRTVHFLLSCNIGEILLVFVASVLGIPAPLTAIQLLWVNLVTDSFPALTLGIEPIRDDVMRSLPIRGDKSIFSGGAGTAMALEGCLIGALSLLAYSIGRVFFDVSPDSPQIGSTMAFAVLSFSQLVHTMNMRSDASVFAVGLFSNRPLVLACGFCAILQAAVIVIPPLARLFHTAVLTAGQWGIVLALSFVPLVVCEAEKSLHRRKHHANAI